MSAKKRIRLKYTSETKCSFCPGSKCCTYITQQIETPRSMTDFDHLLWQVGHENIEAYKDEDGWFLVAMNRCSHLLPSGGCAIYATRPQVCRNYSNDFCEFDAPPEEEFEHYFQTYAELDNYCRQRFKGWDRRFTQPRD